MTDIRFKLSPPWATYVNELKALFGNDPDISIDYDEDECEVKLFVENVEKATALTYLLPIEKYFGNVSLYISIIPANEQDFLEFDRISYKELFDIAFDCSPVYAFSKEVRGLYNNPFTYVVFKNKVVQFFNDNLNDIHGLVSTLYEEIARDVFEDACIEGVFYNTDVEEKVGMPLGEWP